MNYETMQKNDGIYNVYVHGNLKETKILCSYCGVIYYISGDFANPHDESYNKPFYTFVKVGGVPKFVVNEHMKNLRNNCEIVNYEYLKYNEGVYNLINDEEYEGVLASYRGVVYYIHYNNLNVSDGSFGKNNYEFKWAGKVPQKVIDFHNKTHKIDPKKQPNLKQNEQVIKLGEFLCSTFKIDGSLTTVSLEILEYFHKNNLMIENR